MSDFTFMRTEIIAKVRTLVGIGHLNDIVRCRILHFIFEFFNFRVGDGSHFFTGFGSCKPRLFSANLVNCFIFPGGLLSMRITSLYVTKHEEYRRVSPHVVRVFVVCILLYWKHKETTSNVGGKQYETCI